MELWGGTLYQNLNYDIESLVKKCTNLTNLKLSDILTGFTYGFDMDNVLEVWKDILPQGRVITVDLGYGKIFWTSQGVTSASATIKRNVTFNGDGTYSVSQA